MGCKQEVAGFTQDSRLLEASRKVKGTQIGRGC
jgi:hypothetical protein